MDTYRVGGRSTATTATANHVAASLWNPSTAVPMFVTEIHVVSTTAGVSNLALQRSSTRGSGPSSTVTPDIDNHTDRNVTPPSGALLDLGAFATTEPTLDAPSMENWNLPAVIGAAVQFVFSVPIKVAPGKGCCIYTPQAVILPASDFTFVWQE